MVLYSNPSISFCMSCMSWCGVVLGIQNISICWFKAFLRFISYLDSLIIHSYKFNAFYFATVLFAKLFIRLIIIQEVG